MFLKGGLLGSLRVSGLSGERVVAWGLPPPRVLTGSAPDPITYRPSSVATDPQYLPANLRSYGLPLPTGPCP